LNQPIFCQKNVAPRANRAATFTLYQIIAAPTEKVCYNTFRFRKIPQIGDALRAHAKLG
jgi:hypothetical protein